MSPTSSASASGIYYEIYEAPSGDAETVIFSPGLGGSASYWAPQIEAFAQRYRVVLYDHRGCGRSVPTLTQAHSVAAMADDIVLVLDHLDIDRAHFIGHAAGGIAGLDLALRRPERLRRLVVVNGWSKPDPHFRRCFEVRTALLRAYGPAAYVHAQPLFLYPAEWISENADRLRDDEARALAHFPSIEVLLRRIDALLEFDIDARLDAISTPTLLCAAADDMLVPAFCSRHLAAGIPGARLSMAPWGGHAFTAIAADSFNADVLAFLHGRATTTARRSAEKLIPKPLI